MLVGADSGSAEAWDLRGIDQRTDVFSALCALRWEKPGAKRAAEVLLRPRERDEETLAALLLYEELFGAVPALHGGRILADGEHPAAHHGDPDAGGHAGDPARGAGLGGSALDWCGLIRSMGVQD